MRRTGSRAVSVTAGVVAILASVVVFLVPFAFIFLTAAKDASDASRLEFSWPKDWAFGENLAAAQPTGKDHVLEAPMDLVSEAARGRFFRNGRVHRDLRRVRQALDSNPCIRGFHRLSSDEIECRQTATPAATPGPGTNDYRTDRNVAWARPT